jgi:hypothetical protein
LGFAIPT